MRPNILEKFKREVYLKLNQLLPASLLNISPPSLRIATAKHKDDSSAGYSVEAMLSQLVSRDLTSYLIIPDSCMHELIAEWLSDSSKQQL